MSETDTDPTTAERASFPECCRNCPKRVPTTGACGHEHRQTLVRVLARSDEPRCPVYRP